MPTSREHRAGLANGILRVDPARRLTVRPWMISLDQCLKSLVELIASDEDRPLSLAKGYLDAFVPLVRADRIKGGRMLSDLRGQLSRRTEPSSLRDDVLDLLDARIVRLADAEDDLDT